MQIHDISNIKKEINNLTSDEIINSSYWSIIYDNLYLTHELLKEKRITKISSIKKEFLNEEIICLDLLAYNPPAYNFIPDTILFSKSFWINALEKNSSNVAKIPEEILKNNEKFCLWIFEKFSKEAIFQYFPETLRKNFDLAYFSVHFNVNNFLYTSKEIKNSPIIYDVIYNTKVEHLEFFKNAGEIIRANYKFAKQAICESPIALKFSPLKNDPAFFFDLLNYSDNILQFAGKNIQNNENCVLDSVIKNPLSIEWAHPSFKSSPEFILSLHESLLNSNNFNEFSKLLDSKIFSNFNVVNKYFSIISKNSSYSILGEDILNDFELMSKFVIADINAFNFVSNDLKNDILFIKDCYSFYEQTNPLDSYNLDSPQSKIFLFLNNDSLNNINFINDLYSTFKPIFKSVIFPIMQQRKIPLANILINDSENDFDKSISRLLGKLELHEKLEHELINHNKIKHQKI